MNPTDSESSSTTPDTGQKSILKVDILDRTRWDEFLRRYNSGGYSGQRLGQAFINEFGPLAENRTREETLATIYIEPNPVAAISRIKAAFTLI